MSHRLGGTAFVTALALFLPACGAGDSASMARASTPGSGGSASTSVDAGEPTPAVLSFTSADTLTLTPGQEHALEVVATPPGAYRVKFALLGADVNGVVNDAALDRSETETDAEGVARVLLTAPSTPAIFGIRASAGMSVSTELVVSVSDKGYATLRIEPLYSGKRDVTTWLASVRDGQSCDDLTGTPPPDGSLIGSAAKGGFPEITDVPVGPVLAVVVRAGHYVSGCTTLPSVPAGEVTRLPVSMTDRPIDLDNTRLKVTLGLAQPGADWDSATNQAIDTTLTAFSAGAGDDAVLLLDTMQLEADGAAFTSARFAEGWDESVRQLWSGNAASRLRDAARRWMQQGAKALVAPDTFGAELGPDTDGAMLTLTSVAGHLPREAGFNTPLLAAWSADASDTVLFGTSLLWAPSKLLTTLAEEPAVAEALDADGVPAALAELAMCPELAAELVSLGAAPDEAYASCDAMCLQALCLTATETLWERTRGTTTPMPATLAITATGAAKVGDNAEAVQLDGNWVGQLQSGSSVATAGGKLSADVHEPQ